MSTVQVVTYAPGGAATENLDADADEETGSHRKRIELREALALERALMLLMLLMQEMNERAFAGDEGGILG